MSGSSADTTVLRAELDTSGFSAGELRILLSINNLNQAIDGSGQKFGDHEKRINSLQVSAEALAGAMTALAGAFTVTSLIDANAEYDKLSTQLTTVTGSAAGAKAAMGDLISFANTSPYTLSQVTEAFIDLRNAGLDSTTTMLTSLSNVASGMGRPLADITHAINSAAVGNTQAFDGFGIEMQKSGEKITATFQGISRTINATGPGVEKYIASLGNGFFAGDTDRQSNTISGKLSTYEDSIQNVLRAVGDGGFNDAFKGLITDATTANNQMISLATVVGHDLGGAIKDGLSLWKQYGDVVTAVGVGIGTVVAMTTAMEAVEVALGLITAALNPLALLQLGIGAAAAGLYLYRDHMVEVGGVNETVLQAMKDGWTGLVIDIGKASDAVTEYMNRHQTLKRLNDFGNSMSDSINRFGNDAFAGAANLGNTLAEQFYLGPHMPTVVSDNDPSKWSAGGAYGGSIVGGLVATGRAANAAAAATAPAATTTDPLAFLGANASGVKPWLGQIQAAASAVGMPWQLLAWQISQESSGNASAGIGTQHVGLGQFDTATAARFNLTDRTDGNASITAAAQYDQLLYKQTGNYRTAFMRYGTDGTPAADAGFQNAMRQVDPKYALDNRDISNSSATAQAISALQMSAGTVMESGLKAALDKALIAAGFATSDASGVSHGISRSDLVARQMSGTASLRDVSSYDQLTALVTQQYDAGIMQKQAMTDVTIKSNEASIALASMGKQSQLIAASQAVYNKSIADGVPPLLAQRDAAQALTQSMQALRLSAAEGIASTNFSTGQSVAQTRSVAGQGVVFDAITNSYILDTRQTDALKTYQQIDPYNVLTGSQRTAAMSASTGAANASWNATQTNEANQRKLLQANNSDWMGGLKSGWQSYYDDASDINKQVATTFTDSMSSMTDALVSFVKTGKLSWTSLADTVITDLTTMALKSAETGLFNATGVTSFFGSLTGASAASSGMTIAQGGLYATGGVFGGGLGAYSNSIVSTPTYFNGSGAGQRYATGTADLMGEAGPEAIIPLKRAADGSLGVRMSGGSAGGTSVSMGDININNPQLDGGGQMTKSQAAALQKHVSDMTQAAVMKTLANQQRPGGALFGTGKK